MSERFARCIEVNIPIEPVAKARPRMTRSGHVYTPKKTETAESIMRWWAYNAVGLNEVPVFSGAVHVDIEFIFTKPKSVKRLRHTVKPDLDNLIKINDAFNGIFWRDDSQIVSISAKKLYGNSGMVRVVVTEIID